MRKVTLLLFIAAMILKHWVNPEGRKVKGVIHWVSATKNHPAEFRLYDRLFTVSNPSAEEDIYQAL